MKCGYCGKVLKEDAKFCTGCGRSVSEFSEEDVKNIQKQDTSYIGSIITLIMLMVILLTGSIFMILHGLSKNAVSNSDVVSTSSEYKLYNFESSSHDVFNGDANLFGQWICCDKTAANYTLSDYGKEISLALTLTEQGNFYVNYVMTDTGVTALRLNSEGAYFVQNGYLTLNSDLSDGNEKIAVHSSVKYKVIDNCLTFITENGDNITFTKVF